MNTKNIVALAHHMGMSVITASLGGPNTIDCTGIPTTDRIITNNTKTVYQWQTPRGAVVMELLTEADARTWYDKYMKTPTGSFMAELSLYKIEVTKLVTKL